MGYTTAGPLELPTWEEFQKHDLLRLCIDGEIYNIHIINNHIVCYAGFVIIDIVDNNKKDYHKCINKIIKLWRKYYDNNK